MSETTLPTHPVTGLQAVGLRKDGRPIWPIVGAAPEDDETSEDTTGDDDPGADQGTDESADSEPGDSTEGDGAGDLGDKGKQAIARMKEREKAARAQARTAKKERDELKAQLEAKDKPSDEQAIETARRDAAAEATAKANQRILRSEVKAAAAGKLADPTDALRLLDLDQFEVSDDGDVDADELNDAIDELMASKPYLAAQGGTKLPKPDPSQGGKGGSAVNLDTQIAEAQKKGDWRTVISLQNQKLADQATNP